MRIDCMIAENYLNEFNRACDFYSSCGSCPIQIHCGAEYPDAQDMIAAIQKFSDENPRPTYLSELLKNYPNIALEQDGTPVEMCPEDLGLNNIKPCHKDECLNCWNQFA